MITPTETTTATSAVRLGGRSAEPMDPWPVVDYEPATGDPMAEVIGGGRRDASAAVDSAAAAFRNWGQSPTRERATSLQEIAARLRQEPTKSTMATLIARETGKLIGEARAEVSLAAAFFEWFADVVLARRSERWDVVAGLHHEVHERPLGVIAAISPWNFPVSIPARKIAAALAAGCTVVFRPSEIAPLAPLKLAEVMDECLPPGVVNTVIGPPIVLAQAWLTDPRVRGLTFTGSTAVGQALAQQAAHQLKRCVLELGGKAPFVILADADAGAATAFLAAAKYRNNGQSCIAADQVWVPRSRSDAIIEGITQSSAALVLGDPLDPATTLGPLARAADQERLEAILVDAAAAGAEIIRPTLAVPARGHFFAPAICVGHPSDSRIANEEIFGPVLTVQVYDDISEVVESVRANSYGLGGYVAGSDTGRAAEVAGALGVGIVGVNTATPNTPQVPFAGLGMSGLGVEGSELGVREFTTLQTIAISR